MARLLRHCGTAFLVSILSMFALAACGTTAGTGAGASPTPSASPTSVPTIGPTPSATASAAGGGSRCQVAQLTLSVGRPNAGAGQVEQVFILTNTQQTSCALFGYPGMQLLSGGQSIPTTVTRTPGAEQLVTLAPGGTASFLAAWHDQTGFTTPCASSQQVEVTPPNATQQLTIPLSIQACPAGNIAVTAVVAGSAGGQ